MNYSKKKKKKEESFPPRLIDKETEERECPRGRFENSFSNRCDVQRKRRKGGKGECLGVRWNKRVHGSGWPNSAAPIDRRVRFGFPAKSTGTDSCVDRFRTQRVIYHVSTIFSSLFSFSPPLTLIAKSYREN